MKTLVKSQFFWGTALLLAIPFAVVGKAVTQPVPPRRPPAPLSTTPAPRTLRTAPVPRLERRGAQDMERAWRDIRKAEEEAYQVSYLSTELSSAKASELTSLGDRLLNNARTNYEAGNYFQAAETARAAKDVYEAAETLYEGELGYVVGSRGAKAPSRSYYDAPYRVTEELSRAEAEMAYYGFNDSTAIDLLRRARELATPAELPTASIQPASAGNFAVLTNNRAAIHLAKAATHLMRAARGF